MDKSIAQLFLVTNILMNTGELSFTKLVIGVVKTNNNNNSRKNKIKT